MIAKEHYIVVAPHHIKSQQARKFHAEVITKLKKDQKTQQQGKHKGLAEPINPKRAKHLHQTCCQLKD